MLQLTQGSLCVAIDGRALGSHWGGEETYLRALLAGLLATAEPADRFPVWVRPGAPVPRDVISSVITPVHELAHAPGPWHYAVRFPRAVKRSAYPVGALCSTTHAPLRSSIPSVFIIGDLSPFHHPEWFPRQTVVRLRVLWRQHVKTAAAVLVPSEFTRRDVIATLGADPKRVFVVPPYASLSTAAVEAPTPAAGASLERLGVRGPYVLYLGNVHPRKNVPRLIEAFLRQRERPGSHLADHQLVIAGATWFGSSRERDLIAEASSDSLVMVGRVDDEVRELLLRRCAALAYVSLFEGFGLPPLEAMTAGRPVVTSTAGALPETCGDAAIYVDPLDVADIGRGLEAAVSDTAELCATGQRRAASFHPMRTGHSARDAFVHVARR